jgi:hypothetical protein
MNVEGRKSKDEGMSKDEKQMNEGKANVEFVIGWHLRFDIRHLTLIRHLHFVIRHFR